MRTKTCQVINVNLDTPWNLSDDIQQILLTPEEKWRYMTKLGRAHYYNDSDAFYQT